jgi:hypothetical protein
LKYVRTLSGKRLDVPVVVPLARTMARYGLVYSEWYALLKAQGGVCPICGTVPSSGRLVIDHEHVPGWKKMPPRERARHVRGLLCTTDNHFVLTKYGTPSKFRNAADYLEAHEKRRDDA